jgi:hypothetical protein
MGRRNCLGGLLPPLNPTNCDASPRRQTATSFALSNLTWRTATRRAGCARIPSRIKRHIEERLGVVPLSSDQATRMAYAEDAERFLELIRQQIDKTPANFEIFSFSVIKVHLEKFACKIYRDTRTAAHDQGVDLSTNFGVV